MDNYSDRKNGMMSFSLSEKKIKVIIAVIHDCALQQYY